jgi:hypothetical protein
MTSRKSNSEELFKSFYYDFVALGDYNWKMEQSINDLLNEEQQRWALMADTKTRLMRKQWEAWKLLDFFPTTLRQSFVVALFIHVDSKLTQICDHLKLKQNLSIRMSHLNGNIIERSKRYLGNIAAKSISSLDWSSVEELMKVRDCIVHCNGNILISRDQQFLRNLCSTRGSDILKLAVRNNDEGEWLNIQKDYGLIVTSEVRDFINSIGNIVL